LHYLAAQTKTRVYGSAIVHCDPLLPSDYFGPSLTVNSGGVKTNLFDCLEGVTPDFINSLTESECESLQEAYSRGVLGYSRMDDCQGAPYSKEALDDLHQSAIQLTDRNPNYGFSRWSSLQAVEKVLKSFIEHQGQRFGWTHDLTELAAVAVAAGLSPLDGQVLSKIQCKANVRYSAGTVGKTEALQAHIAALSVCADIAPRLNPQSGWKTQTRMTSYALNGKLRPLKALVVTRFKGA
jgi:hypothetical protein